MEKHGGTLDLESTPGEGTRAIVVFPKERVAAVTAVAKVRAGVVAAA